MRNWITTTLVMLIGLPLASACFQAGPNEDYPGSVLGYRMEFTVVDPGSAGIDAGEVIIYEFSAGGQVVGTRPTDGRQFVPESYLYVGYGSSAEITLRYSDGHASSYELTTNNLVDDGLYDNHVSFVTGESYRSAGRYRVLSAADDPEEYYEDDSPPGANSCQWAYDNVCDEPSLCDPGTDSADCDTTEPPPTGDDDRLTIYLTNTTAIGNVCIEVNGSSVGCVNRHFTSGSPTCGEYSSSSAITTTVPVGSSYTVYAEDEVGSGWGPGSFTKQGSCTLFSLD